MFHRNSMHRCVWTYKGRVRLDQRPEMKGPLRSDVICSGSPNREIHYVRSVDAHVAAVSSCIGVASGHLVALSVMVRK